MAARWLKSHGKKDIAAKVSGKAKHSITAVRAQLWTGVRLLLR
jgi:hypothetical protein